VNKIIKQYFEFEKLKEFEQLKKGMVNLTRLSFQLLNFQLLVS